MCGIAGAIGEFRKEFGDQLIADMLKVIEHRGPDSKGSWSRDGFTFGMQRLSIIDIAGGDQPIWSEEGVGIVFNGEIYNYKKLRKELLDLGQTFETNSDTEVILRLYLTDGIEFLKKLEGMFGICIYDPRNDLLLLARDRLGIKPMYYFTSEEKFAFASEIKALLPFVDSLDLNTDSIAHYLSLRYVPGPETVWNNVRKLKPGHLLTFNLKTKAFVDFPYWGFEFKSEKIDSKRNYPKEFESIFLEAVEKRLLASDVPVGILLSGGLDSSCIAAAAVELGHKNFHTFSIGFEDGGQFSELPFADMMAKSISSKHHEIKIGKKEFLDFLQDYVWYADEPLADLASIPLYYVSKLAREHVKVALSGEGSDEVLAGYNLDNHARKLSLLRIASLLPKSLLLNIPSNILNILGSSSYSGFLRHQATHITNVFSDDEKKHLFKFPFTSTKCLIQEWYDQSSSIEPIDQLQQAYCSSWLVEDLLMKADKMSMATSLELRVPFLDHKLVEWASHLPLSWKVGNRTSGFTTKRILRNFAKRRIPESIINRPKQGFPVPAYVWMQSEFGAIARERIESSSLKKLIHIDKLTPYWAQLRGGNNEAAHKVWSLLILTVWLERMKK